MIDQFLRFVILKMIWESLLEINLSQWSIMIFKTCGIFDQAM